MSRNSPERWVVEAGQPERPRQLLEDMVMAWARDRTTGEPRYIGELSREQTGYACKCDCYSCGQALQAVNAGKTSYKRRPSFRHPPGTAKDNCLIVAARAAVLEMLRNEPVLHLPRRSVRGKVQGLSHAYHEAWVEAPSETVRIAAFAFCDELSAILTTEDGRRLRVSLQGRFGFNQQASGEVHISPTIVLIVDDPAIASLSPGELRKRLEIIVDGAQWCSHWDDDRLRLLATEHAVAKATAALDWLDKDVDLADGLSNSERRETLLHLKAKEILARERRIKLPSLEVEPSAGLSSFKLARVTKSIRGETVQLADVVLEQWMGGVRPDVVAVTKATQRWPSCSLMIEITVTNAISEERLQRLMKHQRPVLEIDISRMGGVVTEEEFARLVVDESAGKKWLFHPLLAKLEKEVADDLVCKELAWRRDREFLQQMQERRQREVLIQQTPLQVLVDAFLSAVANHARERANFNATGFHLDRVLEAFDKAHASAEALAVHGYPEIRESSLYHHEGNVIERMIALTNDRGDGEFSVAAWTAVSQILSKRYQNMSWQPFYLLAIKFYRPVFTSEQLEQVEGWRQEVEESLKAGERSYQRETKYDAVMAALFPKLALGLSVRRDSVPQIAGAINGANGHRNEQASAVGGMLTGPAYEAWKLRYPEAAAAWEKAKSLTK